MAQLLFTQRGGRKLFYNGYGYVQTYQGLNQISWRCDREVTSKCKAYVKTSLDVADGDTNVKEFGTHTHDVDPTKLEVTKLMNNLKRKAVESVGKTSAVVSDVLAEVAESSPLSTAGQLSLPRPANLQKLVRRYRTLVATATPDAVVGHSSSAKRRKPTAVDQHNYQLISRPNDDDDDDDDGQNFLSVYDDRAIPAVPLLTPERPRNPNLNNMAWWSRLSPKTSALFLCDMQEKFRNTVGYFAQIVEVSTRMRKAAQILNIPIVATEQYPKGLGPTVAELGLKNANVPIFPKTCFSMISQQVENHLQSNAPSAKSILLCGIETHACIYQTTMDLLERGYDVHLIADACSSRNQVDRFFAFRQLEKAGAHLTTSECALLALLRDAANPRFKDIQKLITPVSPDSNLLLMMPGN